MLHKMQKKKHVDRVGEFQRRQKLPLVLRTGTQTEIFIKWLKEHFEEKPDTGLPCDQVYAVFSKYCSETDKEVECREIFGKLVAETFPSVYKRRLGGRSEMRYYYWCLDVKEDSQHFKNLAEHHLYLQSDSAKNKARMKNYSQDKKICKRGRSVNLRNRKNKNTENSYGLQLHGKTNDTQHEKLDNYVEEEGRWSEVITDNTQQFDNGTGSKDGSLTGMSCNLPQQKEMQQHTTAFAQLKRKSSPGKLAVESHTQVSLSDKIASDVVCTSDGSQDTAGDLTDDGILPNDSCDAGTSSDCAVRRPGRRNATRLNAQKRKASNCMCTDCGGDSKKKRSKVHRMSEILASPRMRSSLRQAIKASLAESMTRTKFVANSRQAKNSDLGTEKKENRSNCESVSMIASQNQQTESCRLPAVQVQDSNMTHGRAVNSRLEEPAITETSGGSSNQDSNKAELFTIEASLKQVALSHSDLTNANPRIWRFLPPLLKKLHKEKVKKWLGEEFEWSPPSCLPRHRVYEHYEAFCNKHLSCAAPPATLGKMLQEKFKMLSMRRLGGRNKYKYYYKGIDIQPCSSAYEMLSKERILTDPKPKRSRVFSGLAKTT